jgi:hypothetical protein
VPRSADGVGGSEGKLQRGRIGESERGELPLDSKKRVTHKYNPQSRIFLKSRGIEHVSSDLKIVPCKQLSTNLSGL